MLQLKDSDSEAGLYIYKLQIYIYIYCKYIYIYLLFKEIYIKQHKVKQITSKKREKKMPYDR